MTHHKFTTTELDPGLLATPYRVQTRWHVLTGAACAGKSTLLDGLAARGFHVIRESARPYYESELAKGRTIQEIRRDGSTLQHGIAALQSSWERAVPPGRTVFLDRAMPDSLTFFRVYGLDPNDVLPQCFHHRYATVFILDRLPLPRATALGPEDTATSDLVDGWLVRDYNALGYSVVRVPVLSLQERLAFVLERLAERS